MLQKTARKNPKSASARIAIVASAYNADYVDGMLDAALAALAEAGVGGVELVRVPGAFEIPTVAAQLARRKRQRPSAVICLGVILRGQTTHAEHIGQNVSRLLGDLAMETGVPIIHEVLLLENKAQARARCLSAKTNRGAEAAHTALEMTGVMRELR
jgi:6,7-dimethyl-8-ribityllumazine synthase